MASEPERLLTATELEIMTILWSLGGGTVHDVQKQLPSGRALAYTSVSTMLRILEQKEFVVAAREGRSHRYLPAVSRERYESRSVRNLVQNVFQGAPSALVRTLLSEAELNEKEVREIRKTLKKAGY